MDLDKIEEVPRRPGVAGLSPRGDCSEQFRLAAARGGPGDRRAHRQRRQHHDHRYRRSQQAHEGHGQHRAPAGFGLELFTGSSLRGLVGRYLSDSGNGGSVGRRIGRETTERGGLALAERVHQLLLVHPTVVADTQDRHRLTEIIHASFLQAPITAVFALRSRVRLSSRLWNATMPTTSSPPALSQPILRSSTSSLTSAFHSRCEGPIFACLKKPQHQRDQALQEPHDKLPQPLSPQPRHDRLLFASP
jgi:hypothetical protein